MRVIKAKKMVSRLPDDEISEFLAKTLPGKTKSVRELRADLRDFAGDLLAKNLLLLGPIGIGKTTLARIVAVLRFLVVVRPEVRKRFLDTLRFDQDIVKKAGETLNTYPFTKDALDEFVESCSQAELSNKPREVLMRLQRAATKAIRKNEHLIDSSTVEEIIKESGV